MNTSSSLGAGKPIHVRAVRRRSPVLAAVALDDAFAPVLRRATEIAAELSLDVKIVHVLGAERNPRILRDRADEARQAIHRWSHARLGRVFGERQVHIEFGDVAAELARVASRLDAELVVIGGRPEEDADPPGSLTSDLVQSIDRLLLVAGPARDSDHLVVGTDLTSEGVPVVRRAAELGQKLGRTISVVHNLGGLDSDTSADLTEDLVARRLERLLGTVHAHDAVVDATVTRERLAAQGVLRVARARDADLVVLGNSGDAGRTQSMVLTEARRSVLFVPLARRGLETRH